LKKRRGEDSKIGFMASAKGIRIIQQAGIMKTRKSPYDMVVIRA
jgi:hypothetical protein